MNGFLRHWNRYGFKEDVFDKYRDAVRRSNHGSVRVLSVLAVLIGIIILAYRFWSRQPADGILFPLLTMAAGAAGAVISFRKNSSRACILAAGYLLGLSIYVLAIYGSVKYRTEVFWIGAELTVVCYLFDYAWKVGLLQVFGYAGLRMALLSSKITLDPFQILFSDLFLLISLVTMYALNRARVGLILRQEESRSQADTDLLTGLTIRMAAQEEIERHLKMDDHGVMMLLDLDRFKSVNDRLGHQKGDQVLIDVAADLKKLFRNSDVLSRLGGDEFVIYLKSVPEQEWALQRASQVVREIRRWVGNGTTNIQVTASVGIVMTNMVSRTYDDLYRAADIAMYTAKSEGGNKALFFSRDMLEQHAGEKDPAPGIAPEDGLR